MVEPLEIQQRAAVVRVARTLLSPEATPEGIGVPWRHMGRTLAGVDCGGVIVYAFKECVLIPADFETGYYDCDFMLHSDDPRFQDFVERFARKVEREPRDGDVTMFKVGRVIAHCGIVDQWPRIIHAMRIRKGGGEIRYDDADNGELRRRFVGVWSHKEWT